MQKYTLRNRFLKIMLVIGGTMSILIIMLAFALYSNARKKIGVDIYKSYFNAYRFDLESSFKIERSKVLQLKEFIQNKMDDKQPLKANDIESILRLSNTSESEFYSIGVLLLPEIKVDTSGGYFYSENQGFSLELTNSYLGMIKLSSFENYRLSNSAWAYNRVLKSSVPLLIEPYEETQFDAVKLFTSYFVPIIHNRKTIGLVKLDINLSELDLKKYAFSNEFTELRLISNNGRIAANTKNKFIGRRINEFEENYHSHLLRIQAGKEYSELNGDVLEIQIPFSFLSSDKLWQIDIWVDSPPYFLIFKKVISLISGFAIFMAVVFLFIISYFMAKEIKPLSSFVKMSKKLEIGDIDIEKMDFPTSEFTVIYESFLNVVDNFKYMANLAIEIGKGNFDIDYKLRSEKDILGKAVLEMEKSLRQSSQEEKRLKEEAQNRAWISNGIAEFGIKLKNTNLEIETKEVFNRFLSQLVDYIDAVQGTIFKLHRNSDEIENWYLSLLVAYAYHQNKYLEKRVEIGEGLVGMCAKEQEPIIIKDVPENYIFIKSAFGATVPRNIVLIPLIFNETVYGVLEIATLNDFEDYKIEFLKLLSENIANTLASSESIAQTNELLERTKVQSQELMAREEELRQNLEEMNATQERYTSNATLLNAYINAIEVEQMTVVFKPDGQVIEFNDNFSQFLGISKADIYSLNLNSILSIEKEKMLTLMREMNLGNIYELEHFIYLGSKKKYFKVIFSPVLDQKNRLSKIIALGTDITSKENSE